MRVRMLTWLAIGSFVLLIPATAGALPITISGGTAGTIPGGAGVNDFIPTLFPGATISGFYGSTIDFSVAATSTLTLDFFGGEADFSDEFDYLGVQRFAHTAGTLISPNLSSPLGTFTTTINGSGVLSFVFDAHSDASHVANGSNPNNAAHNQLGPNFFASCNPFSATPQPTNCDTVYLFLDDSGGGPDVDYDDMLVRARIQAVPEPATLVLIGLGLFAGSLAVRRRN